MQRCLWVVHSSVRSIKFNAVNRIIVYCQTVSHNIQNYFIGRFQRESNDGG